MSLEKFDQIISKKQSGGAPKDDLFKVIKHIHNETPLDPVWAKKKTIYCITKSTRGYTFKK